MRVKVEVCVTSVAEALAAEQAGADSVEVCSWLACGGITPGPGLLSLIKERIAIPKRVLVRPTPTGFVYSDDERQVLLRDALLLVVVDDKAGLVTGALNADGLVDASLMDVVRATLAARELTFHRAIDHATDMLKALDKCIEIGVHRVLTSGGKTLASDGAPMLKDMVRRAGGKVMIAAAGGIRPENVVALVESTGVGEVHFSAQKPIQDKPGGAAMSSASVGLNFAIEPDVEKIEGVLSALLKAGLR